MPISALYILFSLRLTLAISGLGEKHLRGADGGKNMEKWRSCCRHNHADMVDFPDLGLDRSRSIHLAIARELCA
jgi:hypothetical protein